MSDTAAEQNRAAWNTQRYQSWIDALGSPAEEAARIVADPFQRARRLIPHLGDIAGRRICNIQGSHGRVAVGLALLGADATVIDFAEENRRYALELAAAAGVSIDYRLADVIEADRLGLEPFDAVVMELGILHYHQDLVRFFAVMGALTKPGSRMVLNDFHPVERKLLMPGAVGDYFHAELVVGAVPNPVAGGPKLGECIMRGWTLGEIVTASIEAGWRLDRLDELPSWNDPKLPGMFTLVATKVP
jgi:2-polyprenyl-3-methyl-5-hydroxy-6-metoxy-1,4-benzoquinol methylase